MFFYTQMAKLYGEKFNPLQGAGAEHFVLAEGFEGGAGTLVTAIVSPRALKTSMEYPSVPSGVT